MGGGHHADVAFDGDVAHADFAALVGAVEDRQVFVLQVGRAFDGAAAADDVVGFVDLLLVEADSAEEVEVGVLPLGFGDFEAFHYISAQRPGAEGEGDFEDAGQGGFDLVQFRVRQAQVLELVVFNVRRAMQRERAHDVLQDLMNLGGFITKIDQGRTEGLVGDFEISAAGEFLEFDEGEIGLDAGGVAIHQ